MKTPDIYEPYPGCTLEDFELDFLTRNPVTLEAFCKNEHIEPSDLPRLVSEVLTDWELTEETHESRKEAVRHMLNHLRIKIRCERQAPRTALAPASAIQDLDRQSLARSQEFETRKKNSMKPRDYIRSLGYDPDKVTLAEAMRRSRETTQIPQP